MKPIVALTVGDCNGIGPEVILKSLPSAGLRASIVPLLVGPVGVFRWWARRLSLPFRPCLVLPDPAEIRRAWLRGLVPVTEPEGSSMIAVHPGYLSAVAGRAAARAIAAAVGIVGAGGAAGIVTAPVSKKALRRAGVVTPGQTELLLRLSGGKRVAMMLVTSGLRVGLATIHLPLRSVAQTLTPSLLHERISTIARALTDDWAIAAPAIAVLGLNPHAGEDGDLGDEERRIIRPALRELRAGGLSLAGPFPADAFFARYVPGSYDAVLAMYHDQGLIPLKMRARGRGVNVSVGLPLVRTSPDHGTAFDIAGKGTADPASLIEAVRLAALIIRNRERAGSAASPSPAKPRRP